MIKRCRRLLDEFMQIYRKHLEFCQSKVDEIQCYEKELIPELTNPYFKLFSIQSLQQNLFQSVFLVQTKHLCRREIGEQLYISYFRLTATVSASLDYRTHLIA